MHNLTFWRAVLSVITTIFLSSFFKLSIEHYVILWVFIFMLSFYFDRELKLLVKSIMEDSFTSSFGFIYKCFILIIALTIFFSVATIVVLKHNQIQMSQTINQDTIFVCYVLFFSAMIYKVKNKNIPICKSKNKEN
jgi:type IV secretory pathway TrbL component